MNDNHEDIIQQSNRPRLESLDLLTLSPRKNDKPFLSFDINNNNIEDDGNITNRRNANIQTKRKKKNTKKRTTTTKSTNSSSKKKNMKKSNKKKVLSSSSTNNNNNRKKKSTSLNFTSPSKNKYNRKTYKRNHNNNNNNNHIFQPTPEKNKSNFHLSLDGVSANNNNNTMINSDNNNNNNTNLIPFDLEAGNSMQFFPTEATISSNHNNEYLNNNNNSSNKYFLDNLFANTNDIEPQSPHLGPTSFANLVKTPATITQFRNNDEDDGENHYILGNDDDDNNQHYEFSSLDDDDNNNNHENNFDNFEFDVFSPSSSLSRGRISNNTNKRSSKKSSSKRKHTATTNSNNTKRKGKRTTPSSSSKKNKRQKVRGNTSSSKKKVLKDDMKTLEEWDKEDIAAFDKALYKQRDMTNLDMHAYVSKIVLDLAPRKLSMKSICMFYKTESQKMLNILQQPRPDKPIIGNDIYTNIKALRIYRKLFMEDFEFISLRILGWNRASYKLRQQFSNRFIKRVNYMLTHKEDDGVSILINNKDGNNQLVMINSKNDNNNNNNNMLLLEKQHYYRHYGQKPHSENQPETKKSGNDLISNTNAIATNSASTTVSEKNVGNMAPPRQLPSHYNNNKNHTNTPGEYNNNNKKKKTVIPSAAVTSTTTTTTMTTPPPTNTTISSPQQQVPLQLMNKNIVVQLYPRTDRTKSVASCSKSKFNNPMVRYNMLCDKHISLVLEALAKRFTVKETIASHPYFFSNQESPNAHLPRLWPLRALNHHGWGSEHVSLSLNDILMELQQMQQHAAMALQIQPPNQIVLKLEYDWV